MTITEINAITDLSVIEERRSQIREAMDVQGADHTALLEEAEALNARKKVLQEALEKRNKLAAAVANGEVGTTVRTFGSPAPAAAPTYGIDTAEYRDAWLKNLRGDMLTDAEKRAITIANAAPATMVVNDILTAVRDYAPLLQYVTVIPGAAKIIYYVEDESAEFEAEDHTENAKMTPSDPTLNKVELDPKEITKLVQISDTARTMSIPAFNTWLVKILGEAVARKITGKIVAAMTASAASAGSSITAATVQALLGMVKGSGVRILCNRQTLFTKLLPLQDNSKHALVTFNGSEAYVYGVPVEMDDHMANDTLLAGAMSKFVAELAEGVTVKSDFDITTNSYFHLGVAMFDGKVGLASAFAKITAA